MKNILKISVAVLASASLFAGCIKETFPTNGASKDQLTDPMMSLNALSAAMTKPGAAGLANYYDVHFDFGLPSVHIVLESMCEDFAYQGAGMDWFWYWGQNKALSYEYIYCNMGWDNYYPWIMNCNDIIKTIDANTPDSDYQHALGMAYLYRAYCYLDLVRMYEFKENIYTDGTDVIGLGVPIVTEETTEEMGKNNPRAKVEDVFQLIFDDLKRAETFLEGYSRPNKTMPDLSVVYGLYARAYLWRGDVDDRNYALAAEYARKAINTSGCTPLTQDAWEDPITGFNTMSASSWMWALSQSSDNVNNLLNYVAFMNCENTWGYGPQALYGVNLRLYNQVSDKDFRKHSWIDPQKMAYYDYKTVRDADFIS